MTDGVLTKDKTHDDLFDWPAKYFTCPKQITYYHILLWEMVDMLVLARLWFHKDQICTYFFSLI